MGHTCDGRQRLAHGHDAPFTARICDDQGPITVRILPRLHDLVWAPQPDIRAMDIDAFMEKYR